MKSIITKSALLAVAAISTLTPLAQAQNNDKNNNTDVTTSAKRFWEASLPGGNYMVALDRISSVSMHSYVFGTLLIHEVNVITAGAGHVRFYTYDVVGADSKANIAKNAIDRGKSLIDRGTKRAGVDSNTTVEKTPHTTHLKTIEYRVFNRSDLNQLYNSVKRAWRENRGRKFSVR